MKFIFSFKKPDRDRLWGLSPSQFKTFLKRRGFRVDRDFFKMGAMAKKGNRLYRFRYWAFPDFFVDISCPLQNSIAGPTVRIVPLTFTIFLRARNE